MSFDELVKMVALIATGFSVVISAILILNSRQ